MVGLVGEETPHPQVPVVVVVQAANHPEDPEEVGLPPVHVRLDELPKKGSVPGVYTFVGVEGDDPVRAECACGREQAVPVLGVVPPRVALPPGVCQ
jgi:hypothetical protein